MPAAPPAAAAPASPADLRRHVLDALRAVAPELDPAALDPARPLRDQVDLDSMDWLNLLDAVGDRLGNVPAASRPGAAASLDDLVAAAGRALGHRGTASGAPVVARQPRRMYRLADGRRITLHTIRAADAARESAFVRALSAQARYKRFMSTLVELPPAKLRYFTDVDQVRHIALAAFRTGDRCRTWVGVARCVADPAGEGCEFALVVADDWQHSGLAGVLMSALMRAARAQGRRTMSGTVLATNAPMLTLARQLGFAVRRDADEPGLMSVQRAL
jgi:acetyltransferase